MLRTKPDGNAGFDDNSYRAPDQVNALKWDDLNNSEYQHNVAYYKGLLAFRKAHLALRLLTREDVLATVKPVSLENHQAAAYLIEDSIYVIFNASAEKLTVSLPEGTWNLNIYENTAGTDTISQVEKYIQVPSISTTLLTRC